MPSKFSELSVWIRADITLLEKETQTTKTVPVINRRLPADEDATHAILLDCSGLGLAVGQSGSPVYSSGSITLDDTPGSFGEERRFSDILQRYTPINQNVVIYATQYYTTDDDVTTTLTGSQVWSGICTSIKKGFGRNERIVLEIEQRAIVPHYLNRVINSEDHENAPSSSLGQALPLIFGETKYVKAFALETDTTQASAGIINFAYATNRGADWPYPASNEYYAKAEDGFYRLVYSKTYNTAWGSSNTASSNYPTAQGTTEQAIRIIHTSLDYSIIVGGKWWFRGQNNGGITPTGEIHFALYRTGDNTLSPNEAPIAEAVVNKSDYLSDVRGASDFYVEFAFNQPVVFGDFAFGVGAHHHMWLGMWLSSYTGSATTDFVNGGVTNTGPYILRLTNGKWSTITTGAYKPLCALYSLQFTDSNITTMNSDGHGYANLALRQNTYSHQTEPEIWTQDILIDTDGIRDDASAISSSPTLTQMHHVLEFLTWEYNGSAWVANADYDFSTYSSDFDIASPDTATDQIPERYFGGYTEGSITQDQLIEQLCREGMVKQFFLTSGKLTFWPYGVERDVERVFSDENCQILNWRILDRTTVVNRVKFAYGKTIANVDLATQSQGDYSTNFTGTLDLASDYYAGTITEDSEALYGKRELDELSLNFIDYEPSVYSLGYLTLQQYDHPHFLVTIEVDYHDNYDLELISVIDLVTPQLPAFLGTSSRARLATYEGTEVDINPQGYWKRAQRYRCQIIGRELNLSREDAPSLVLDLRVISPYHPHERT